MSTVTWHNRRVDELSIHIFRKKHVSLRRWTMFCKCFVLIGPPNNTNCIRAEQLVIGTHYCQINILSHGRCQKHKRYNYPILRSYFPLVEQLVNGTHYSQINIMSAYRCQNHKHYTYPSLGSYFPLSVDVCGRYTVHYTY